MATHTPTHDPRDGGNFEYTGGAVERPDLVDALERRVDGDVRFDEYSRRLYATDASAYDVTPIGVVFPESTADVAAVHEYCYEREIPVLPRGGGTSLAGQSVNEAVVLDMTHSLDTIHDVDPNTRTARLQAGAYIGDLNVAAKPHGLKFAPDPAWRDKSAIGGAIGNNSTGSHSLKYGKTDHYIEELEVVLADGTVTSFGEVPVEELRSAAVPNADELLPRIYAEIVRIIDEEADAIDDRYPEMKRNVSGYNLDRLLAEYRGEYGEKGVVNLGRLLAGSEGTLATVTEATVSLVEIPTTKAVALLAYEDLLDAMEDVAPVLEHDPAAVEVMDDVLLGLAADTAEFGPLVGTLPEGTDSVLLVEFYADSDDEGRRKVADLIADRTDGTLADGSPTAATPSPSADVLTSQPRRAFAAMEAHDPAERDRFWKMRKSGLPILLSRTSDAKHIAFIEDCAIPPEHLPEYTTAFQEILEDNGTFATFYAHAGPGVLHVRPLINTKNVDGVDAMVDIADRVTDEVVRLGGSVSGEHGDGRARTQWNRKLYGDDLWATFRDLKTAFDPPWLLNPGNVCGEFDMREHLRFDPDYKLELGFDPALEWATENGMAGMVELCHGCGGCRGPQETTGGVMCPTFRASEEEIQATRGRANMLRGAMSGELDVDPTDEEFVTEVMDLCVGCKGCATDCPSEVDMAKLKTEVEHARHEKHGVSLRTRLFGAFESLAPLGSRFAPIANAAPKIPGARLLMEKTIGIARQRELPTFRAENLRTWFDARGGPMVSQTKADHTVLLFPDVYTTYTNPGAGKAAVRILEAANCHVQLADVQGSGRPAYSKGLIENARAIASDTVTTLSPSVADGWDVVVVEPSDAVMLQSDYADLLGGAASDIPDDDVATVAANSYGIMEYVDRHRLDENLSLSAPSTRLTYHGHCHQKATKKDHHAVGVLRRAGYGVDPLDSTCCGMAGSFGYEAEHYSMSTAIGRLLYEQVADSDGDEVVAPGASCRSQLKARDGATEEPPHPVERLAAALD